MFIFPSLLLVTVQFLNKYKAFVNSSSVSLTKKKQSVYSPVRALKFPGGSGSQISKQPVHEAIKVVSPTHRPPLPPRKYSWYSLLLEA